MELEESPLKAPEAVTVKYGDRRNAMADTAVYDKSMDDGHKYRLDGSGRSVIVPERVIESGGEDITEYIESELETEQEDDWGHSELDSLV